MSLIFSACIISLLASTQSYADANQNEKFVDFEKQIGTASGGKVRLKYEYFGEPINEPATLSLFLSCNSIGPEYEMAKIPMCSIEDYRFEKPVNQLTVRFKYSRVDAGGIVHCDQKNDKQFNVKAMCREYKRIEKSKKFPKKSSDIKKDSQ